MKITQHFDSDGWLCIRLDAETAAEAGQLAKFGLNANADARKVSHVSASDSGITANIYLHTVRRELHCSSITRH